MAAPCASVGLQPRALRSAAPSRPPAALPVAPQKLQHRVRASSRDGASSAQDSRSMLEAFFVGRAVAEVLNERLGAAFGDALANFGTWDAETRQQIREFQEEVLQRAQREMLAASGVDATASSVSGSSGGDATSLGGSAVTADLPALVDDLRAEVAATRAVVQQLKQQQQQRSSVQ